MSKINMSKREEVIREIIDNIPLCRDRITKCSCRNHDLNDEVFNYLNDLLNENSK